MKNLLLLKTIALVACLSTALTISAYDFYKDGIYYNRTSSSTVEVTGDFEEDSPCISIDETNYSGEVIIPRQVTYNGVTYTVERIGAHAFKNSGISNLVIPATVGYIGYHAFERCDFSSIECYSSDPNIIDSWGWGVDYGAGHSDYLYVLPTVLSDYQNSFRWQGYCRNILALDVVMINSTNFPDAVFRNYLLSLFPAGYLTSYDIDNLTSLNVANKGIANLKGIEFFSELKELRCWSNSFTSLDLNSNTELTYLDCAPNSNLTSLDVWDCSKLQTLICYSTKITSLLAVNKPYLTKINCSNCTSLKSLYCYNNNLTTLNVSGCTALENLQCYYNDNLAEITGLGDCTAITYLDCEDCAITDLSAVNNLNNLQSLYCRVNKITSLTVTNKSNLTYVRASGNTALTDVNITGNSNLATLNINNCTALKNLYSHTNNLTTLNVEGNNNMIYMSCRDNPGLTGITGLASCTALKSFYCYSTSINDLSVVNSLSDLEILSCYNTKITSLTVTNKSHLTMVSFRDCPVLTNAVIESNSELATLYSYNCPVLISLSCKNNKLTSIDLSNDTKLEKLDCSNNNLSSLNVAGMTALNRLDCRNNQLTSLYAQGCLGLTFLNCFGNQLTSLSLQNCPSLYSVQINVNRFTDSGMTTLINSLRTCSSSDHADLYVRSENSSEENVFTRNHLIAANNKNWDAWHFINGSWVMYTASLPGDVNGDGNVTISDVTSLIDIMLSNGTAPAQADVNGDGNVTISDVTSLIDLLLSGTAKGSVMLRTDESDGTFVNAPIEK